LEIQEDFKEYRTIRLHLKSKVNYVRRFKKYQIIQNKRNDRELNYYAILKR